MLFRPHGHGGYRPKFNGSMRPPTDATARPNGRAVVCRKEGATVDELARASSPARFSLIRRLFGLTV